MASAVDSRLAYARLSAVATASRLPTANRGSNNSYTTSWDTTDDTLSIRKYYVSDKHELEHSCYNAMLNINTAANERVTFGLLDEDLDKFDARSDENEDIIIKVR